MGKPTGFMEYDRVAMPSRQPDLRLSDFYEIYQRADQHVLKEQGARCMDCGVPFCQSDTGCPIDNLIPEWNDLIYHGRWRDAYERLARTNNFPEFTGRICPAPCEESCVLGINEPPVTIKSIECAIIDRAFEEGWVVPNPPTVRTGKKVAVVGSGPAGLAAADQLNKAGHEVTVFERDDRIGGLLMYGVPNMKLEKDLVDRRVALLRAEGIRFQTNANVGGDRAHHGSNHRADKIDPQDLLRDFDAILLACGALQGRDLDKLPGRNLQGVHMAMEYLWKSTQSFLDSQFQDGNYISAQGKDVIVIGGGDTGTDCIGTALRQNCKSLTNITRRSKEPDERDERHPWPGPTGTFYIDYGHAEAAARYDRDPRSYGILPKGFVDDGNGNVKAMHVSSLEWTTDENGKKVSREVPGSDRELPAQLVLLSIGFTGHDTPKLIESLGIETDWGQVKADYGSFATSADKVFTAGDMRRGASLIVWAIAEGRGAAHAIDAYLMGSSELPAPGMETGQLSSAG
ncbi:glutamate synthase subunit beta [Mucisphaera calidilacus]|uniref:Glutamate synthase [NADPH] small chain n=1 Tax=Mucisphaera calidilacus TaxID=2527982 RepID=A0A518C125_9BACT|nr:glutamate synthase subunit beta [Mucisphaera calidilacus]QDU72918.1 Glutamate synthase [NADPH] small chain [Mucisphaera calidilacus]